MPFGFKADFRTSLAQGSKNISAGTEKQEYRLGIALPYYIGRILL